MVPYSSVLSCSSGFGRSASYNSNLPRSPARSREAALCIYSNLSSWASNKKRLWRFQDQLTLYFGIEGLAFRHGTTKDEVGSYEKS
jgi:hypothetical protein